jgi:hypothetical protein
MLTTFFDSTHGSMLTHHAQRVLLLYCLQVAGFFVIESYVQRVTDGLVGPVEGAALWAGAQRSLKSTLEAAFEQLSTASLMLMVKDFVLLVCVALERAGYQVRSLKTIL